MNGVVTSEAIVGLLYIIGWLGLTFLTIFAPSWWMIAILSVVSFIGGSYVNDMGKRYKVKHYV